MNVSSINSLSSQQTPQQVNIDSDYIDKQVKILQEKLKKIKQDAHMKSGNPDLKAARGEEDANRDANNNIAQQLEMQISNLQNRKAALANKQQISPSTNNTSLESESQKSPKQYQSNNLKNFVPDMLSGQVVDIYI